MKCRTFSNLEIPSDIRERMDADREEAEKILNKHLIQYMDIELITMEMLLTILKRAGYVIKCELSQPLPPIDVFGQDVVNYAHTQVCFELLLPGTKLVTQTPFADTCVESLWYFILSRGGIEAILEQKGKKR